MDELKAIEKLVERAKLEPADVPSVADGILARMHHSPPRRITPLSVLAVASAVGPDRDERDHSDDGRLLLDGLAGPVN